MDWLCEVEAGGPAGAGGNGPCYRPRTRVHAAVCGAPEPYARAVPRPLPLRRPWRLTTPLLALSAHIGQGSRPIGCGCPACGDVRRGSPAGPFLSKVEECPCASCSHSRSRRSSSRQQPCPAGVPPGCQNSPGVVPLPRVLAWAKPPTTGVISDRSAATPPPRVPVPFHPDPAPPLQRSRLKGSSQTLNPDPAAPSAAPALCLEAPTTRLAAPQSLQSLGLEPMALLALSLPCAPGSVADLISVGPLR